MRREGELTFEKYLQERGIPFEYERRFPGKAKRPDYVIKHENIEYLLDVKDFDSPKGSSRPDALNYDPYKPIRAKIDKGREKFKEFSDWPCGLVLFNSGVGLVDIETPDIVLGAMYGNLGAAQPMSNSGLPVGEPYSRFLGGGKMNRSRVGDSMHSRVSALITLRKVHVGFRRLTNYGARMKLKGRSRIERAQEKFARLSIETPAFDRDEEGIGVIVWENAYAKIPFPRGLFNGDLDVIYGVDQVQTRVFAGRGIVDIES